MEAAGRRRALAAGERLVERVKKAWGRRRRRARVGPSARMLSSAGQECELCSLLFRAIGD